MKSIGIDIGTTKICVLLKEWGNGKILQVEHENNGAFLPSESEWEKVQNVKIIEERTFKALERIPLDDVASIGVTGQMHGILYLDEKGNPVSNLYTWQDGRGSEYTKLLGCSTGYGSVTDYYNREHGLIPENAVTFCTIHDYIVMKLTGRKKPLVHSSDAASFGCFDAEKKVFTRDNPFYPEVCDDCLLAGYYKNIPVSVAIGDNQAGFIGSGCGEDDVLINVGTGAQVSLIEKGTGKKSAIVEKRPLNGGKCILAGSSLCGGRSYALLEKFFRDVCKMSGLSDAAPLYEKMNEMIAEYPETSLKFDNRFSGTREDGNIRGSITNISTENFTPKDFISGCVRGIASELYDIYISMEQDKKGKIIGSGNGIRRNKALVKCLEELFGLSLTIVPYEEEAATGAAIFGEMCNNLFA